MSIVATSPQTCLLWELGLWLQPAHKAWRCPQISLTINKSRAAGSRNSNPLALCCSLSLSWPWIFFPSQRTKAAGWHGAQSTLWWCDQTSHVNKTRDRWVRAALPKKTLGVGISERLESGLVYQEGYFYLWWMCLKGLVLTLDYSVCFYCRHYWDLKDKPFVCLTLYRS